MIEKLTVVRVGEPKTINYTNKKTGRPDSFNKVGIQTQEHGAQWFDFTFRGNHGLEVSKQYEFETSSREYQGKTYWDAKFVKPADKTDIKIEQILNQLVGIKIELAIIKDAVQPRKKSYPTAESEGIDSSKAFPDEPSNDDLNDIFPPDEF